MIIRGICCLIPENEKNIEVISVVDRFLEHTRFFIFNNNGKNETYISSADWMTRNIENRVEVGCPIYDKDLQQEILDTFNISWNDNIKARIVNQSPQNNIIKPHTREFKQRSQWSTYAYYENKLIK